MSLGHSAEWTKYEKQLKKLGEKVYPIVIAETLNQVAGFAHYASQKNLRQKFTLRNKYVENGLKFWKANPKTNIDKINAVTGSITPFMDVQETGGIRKPKKGKSLPIPTLRARGGNKSSRIKKRYYAGQLSPGMFIGKSGKTAKLGIFERYGKKKNKIRMIRNLMQKSALVKPTHWHSEAMKHYTKGSVIEKEFIKISQEVIKRF
jgi:hypothetical protein